MASLTLGNPKPQLWEDPQFVQQVAEYTMKSYYHLSRETDASPKTGFCIPVTPDGRTTNSPTGGVVGRYLAKVPNDSSSSWVSSEHNSTAYTALNSPPASPVFATAGNILSAAMSSASISTAPTVALSEIKKSAVCRKPLDPEDREFLFKHLDAMAQAESLSPMTELVPVHQGRPGEHILRANPLSGDLYACIPSNPYAPKNRTGQQEYSLASYDSYIKTRQTKGGHRAQEPYPAMGVSSLKTCNHCLSPNKILHNDSLCPFHAYYIATGRFLGYYEFCALVEMEKHGLSVEAGWWTIEDMVKFADALTTRMDKWRFVAESTEIPEGSWISKASPFGPVGGLVPQTAKGKTAIEFGTQQILAKKIGRDSSQIEMGPRLRQVYNAATGIIYA